MKIKGRITDGVEASVLKEAQSKREQERVAQNRSDQAQRTREDTVRLGLGKLIGQELDPTKLAAERQAKIEELKKQIAEGRYDPPVEAVAQAVGQDIVFEILSTDPRASETEVE